MGWERYVAIAKPMKYKVLVRKRRIKRYSGIVWITVFTAFVLLTTLQAVTLPPEFLTVLHLIEGVFWLISFLALVYFYSMVYSKARKQSQSQNQPNNCQDTKQNCVYGVSANRCRFPL